MIDEAGMEQAWRPKEFENDFAGPIRLREALVHSRNLVSIRLMREIGARLHLELRAAVRLRQVATAA